jgi:hypothetical protein
VTKIERGEFSFSERKNFLFHERKVMSCQRIFPSKEKKSFSFFTTFKVGAWLPQHIVATYVFAMRFEHCGLA